MNPPTTMWHVGRASDPLHFSRIDAVDADRSGGNRFDVPGGAVLYAATDRRGAYAETVARLRPSTSLRAIQPEADEHFMLPGAVAADWRTQRRLVGFGLEQPFPFVDIDDVQTHTYLMQELAPTLTQLGVEELDVSIVRGHDRRLTRALARWAYQAVDVGGQLRFAGIRFMSRLGEHELWAIFDGAAVVNEQVLSVERDDPALLQVAKDFDLTIH